MNQIAKFMKFLTLLGVFFTSIGMLACFAFGMLKMGIGMLAAAKGGVAHWNSADPEVIHSMLGGLELFFLAPLPYLTFMSITKLVDAMFHEMQNPQAPLAQKNLEYAQERVGKVKRLIVGLMIAIVSTELIHRLIAPEGASFSGPAFWIPAAVMIGLILALSVYHRVSATERGVN